MPAFSRKPEFVYKAHLQSLRRVLTNVALSIGWSRVRMTGALLFMTALASRIIGYGLPHLEAITHRTIKRVMRRNLTCRRHHPDQGCGNPEASTPPSSPVG